MFITHNLFDQIDIPQLFDIIPGTTNWCYLFGDCATLNKSYPRLAMQLVGRFV